MQVFQKNLHFLLAYTEKVYIFVLLYSTFLILICLLYVK